MIATDAKTEYESMTRIQRLAIFLVVIGPETAAEVLKEFDDESIELICKEMARLSSVDSAIQQCALQEFSGVIAESHQAKMAGPGYVRQALEIARGSFKASSILEKVAPSGTAARVIEEVEQMEPRQIFNLIKTEQPQTISFVISYLEKDKASTILDMFSSEAREQIIEKLGMMEPTSLELIAKIAGSLHQNLDTSSKSTLSQSGGVNMVSDLLKAMDKEESKNIINNIEERNATLGAQIRKKLFVFEDLERLDAASIQRIMREVDSGDILLSLKTASESLRECIMGGISKRAAENLIEELEMMGPVKITEVEAAQDRVIQVVRGLEEQEEISLDGGGQTV